MEYLAIQHKATRCICIGSGGTGGNPGCLCECTYIYMYVCTTLSFIHVMYICMRAILHTCDTHIYTACAVSSIYRLCLLPLTYFPPTLLHFPPSHLYLPFLPHTSLHSYIFPVQDGGVHWLLETLLPSSTPSTLALLGIEGLMVILFILLHNGGTELEAHISDVSFFMRPHTMSDMEAQLKWVGSSYVTVGKKKIRITAFHV